MTTASPTMPSSSTPTALPGPGERPDADVVIFDGQCRICSAQIRRLARWDRSGRLVYLSLHDPEVTRRYPDLTHEAMMAEMYVVDRLGRRHPGADAIRYLSRRLPMLWWTAPVLHLPGTLPIWKWLYRQVANRRYRFGRNVTCDGGTCHLHVK